MNPIPRRALAASLITGALVLTSCSGGNSAGAPAASDAATGGAAAPTGTLVVDTAFSIDTMDPARAYDPTGYLIQHAVYDTLLTFSPGATEPEPSLATYEQNDDATEFTFTLTGERTFSDGSPITADDVEFSLNRLLGMTDAKPNFLMAGMTVTKVDDTSVKITTKTPSLQVPAIVTNPSLAIVNADVVEDNGGTTDNSDKAQAFLDAESAGSGPYLLENMDVATQVTLVANPDYDGDTPAAYEKIVIRNITSASTQLTNLKGGETNIAVDLNGDLVSGLGDGFTIESTPSAQVIFLRTHQNPEVAGDLANVKFAEAIRYGLDYPKLLELAGAGAVEAPGMIPPGFAGSLPEGVTRDLDRSKAAAKEAGYTGQEVRLQFPNDIPVGGVDFTSLAERVQAQLKEAGINVALDPAPFATQMERNNAGSPFTLWWWGPDYQDSTSYLPFGAGEMGAMRGGWTAEMNPKIAGLVADAKNATDLTKRTEYFTEYAEAMQEEGPFIPLIVPGVNLTSDDTVTGLSYNPTWTLDLTRLKPVS